MTCKIIIGIPAYNEGKQIADIVYRCNKTMNNYYSQFATASPLDTLWKVLVINDGSYDNTESEALKAGATVLSHNKNTGVGSAIKTLFEFSKPLLNGQDILITLDGDGQHFPEDIPKMLDKINEGYDIVNGARFYPTNLQKGLNSYKTLLNYIASAITSILSGYRLNDSESGFRAHKSWIIEKINLNSNDYGWNSEALIRLHMMKAKLTEVPIQTKWGVISLGHKRRGLMYGIKILIRLIIIRLG